ncbi:MAG: SDR family NAD(P)-dependent oxidoreductase [Coriobacteriia bacterium]
MELGLAGKVVVVTGACRGIGRAIAKSLCKEGSSVVIADINEEGALAVAREIEAAGGKSMALGVAVQDALQVREMVRIAVGCFGRIDVLVNNAAVNSYAATAEITPEQWMKTLDVNLTGVFNCSQAVMGVISEQRGGRIINISSVNAFSPGQSNAAYVATKAGILGLTRKFAKELAPFGVTVNAVAPSKVLTEMNRKSAEGMSQADIVAPWPLGRLCEPEDVANAVVFLASEAASFITGQVIHVNGGVYFGN